MKILPAGGELTNCLLLARDGLETFIDGNVAPIRDDQGNILDAVLTLRDITERKRAEEEIDRHNRELTLLNQIIAASVTSLEPENFLETACRALAPAFDLPLVTAALLSQDKTTAVVVAEYTLKKQSAFLNRSFVVDRDALLQPLLVNKTPMSVTDVRDDPRCAQIFGLLLHQHNVVSLLMLPLVIDGEMVGLLALGSLELHRFTVSVTNLAWTVANQVAGALSRVQLNQQRRQLSAVIEQTAESVIITDVNGTITYVNSVFEQVSGYSQDEVIGRNPHILRSGKQDSAFYQQLWETIRSGQEWRGRLTNRKKDGTPFEAGQGTTFKIYLLRVIEKGVAPSMTNRPAATTSYRSYPPS